MSTYPRQVQIYSPGLGRFLQTDPIGYDDQMNLYAYVGNDPLNKIDPTGRAAQACAVSPGTCAAVAAAGFRGLLVVGGMIAATPPVIKIADAIGNKISDAMRNEEASSSSQSEQPEQSKGNTNPYDGPVSSPVIVVDSAGNAIPVKTGEQITGSKDGDYQQVRDKDGNQTGVRLDRGGHRTQSDAVARGSHAHVPGVTQPDGNPHLPAKCAKNAGEC